MEKIKVLSIDIGIINLGYVYCEIGDDLNVIECNRVDITHMRHNKTKHCDCKLHHDFCIPDYLDHFIQEHQNLFDESDVILVERQPIMGLQNLQDFFFIRFRKKIKLISPNAVHKFFKMTKCDYELRKIESVNLTMQYLSQFLTFQSNERKHDISDAMLMILYYKLTKKVKVPLVSPIKKELNFNMDFEQFRYSFLTKN